MNEKNTRVLKLRKVTSMEKKVDFSNRSVREAWLKEHGGKAVKEDNVWYWVAPEKPNVTAEPKKGKKKLF